MWVKRVTETKDNPEDDAAVAALMAEWGEILLKAHRECLVTWAAAHERGDLPKLELPRPPMLAYWLVHWVAAQLGGGLEGAPARAALERIAGVVKAKGTGDRQAVAVRLVEEKAKLLRDGVYPADQVAISLATSLCLHVGGFNGLFERLEDVVALLERWDQNKPTRRTPKGTPTKISAAGILMGDPGDPNNPTRRKPPRLGLNDLCDPKPFESWSGSGSRGGASNANKRKR